MWAVLLSAALAGDLRVDPVVDGLVTGLGGAAWVVGESAPFGPRQCRWCDERRELNPLDRSFRTAFLSKDPDRADGASDVLAFGFLPAIAIGLGSAAADADFADGREIAENALLIAETAAIAADVTILLKLSAGRQRPFVRALPGDRRPFTPHPRENNVSFFSGHTTLAFALAVGAGTTMSLREYSGAPYVWAIGLSAATAVGCLRMAADQHYFTDVLTGALVGTAVGIAVPMAHRVREDGRGDGPQTQRSGPLLRFSGRF